MYFEQLNPDDCKSYMIFNEERKIEHYAEIVDIATEMKRFVKSMKEKKGSNFFKDRRK